uniref:Uncharacterized protein n=1 Tax=Parascaris equorum TaxID=6256 RepID=A0A914REC9_PAREQ
MVIEVAENLRLNSIQPPRFDVKEEPSSYMSAPQKDPLHVTSPGILR